MLQEGFVFSTENKSFYMILIFFKFRQADALGFTFMNFYTLVKIVFDRYQVNGMKIQMLIQEIVQSIVMCIVYATQSTLG